MPGRVAAQSKPHRPPPPPHLPPFLRFLCSFPPFDLTTAVTTARTRGRIRERQMCGGRAEAGGRGGACRVVINSEMAVYLMSRLIADGWRVSMRAFASDNGLERGTAA